MEELSYREIINAVKRVNEAVAASEPIHVDRAYETIPLDEYLNRLPAFGNEILPGDIVTPYGAILNPSMDNLSLVVRVSNSDDLSPPRWASTGYSTFSAYNRDWVEQVGDLSGMHPSYRYGLMFGKIHGKPALIDAAYSELKEHMLTVCREIRDDQAAEAKAARLDTDPNWGIF